MKINNRFFAIIMLLLLSVTPACEKDDAVEYKKENTSLSEDEIDRYFQENFQDKYGCAIRWKWVDRYVDISYVVAPTKRSVLIQVGEMIKTFWIEPFLLESKESGEFIRKHFPPEIVCIGSPLRNADGSVTLGYADSGVRITLTELNFYDLSDRDWVIQQLHTIHHEFTHIVHQLYNMPMGFNEVTPNNYTGQAWSDIYTVAEMELINQGLSPTREMVDALAEEMSIAKGMLTPYGTSTEFEDISEFVSLYLLTNPTEFDKKFLLADLAKPHLNEGKGFIGKKLDIVKDYYKNKFNINLTSLRDIIQQRLNDIK